MKFNYFLFLFCASVLLFACNINQDPKGELIVVQLSPSLISLNQNTDIPMNVKSKLNTTVDPNQVIYAIQVYENDSAYYYGLFDKVDSMKIGLTTGKNYRFKVTTFKVGTGSGLKQEVLADGKYFYLPNKTLLSNKFIKGNVLKDINLISSFKLTKSQVKDYPEIDAFYCDKIITVEKGLSNIEFNLLRMGFGVTYIVDGLTDGKLNIIMGNDTTTLNSNTPTATSIRLFNVSMGDISTIFKNANTYADSILIKVQWIGSNGTILNIQNNFKFTRNYQKTINVQLNTTSTSINFEDWNTLTDIDGNVYKTITIGSQTWMAENLKVVHYRDGSAIPNITSNSTWGGLTTGAWCDFSNLSTYGAIYGHFYNGYAAVDSRNIAPNGWHVPSDIEWTILTNYLGGGAIAGAKLKEIGLGHWLYPNTAATNETGFTGIANGSRRYSGEFDDLGKYANFYTSTMSTGSNLYYRALYYNDPLVNVKVYSENYGFAIRCIKD